ncbi:MAG TPA: hypothetical protein VL967_09410 [Terracidiphilus sp.]|nr:hypothetical protein [Terracidiphilus sp.]
MRFSIYIASGGFWVLQTCAVAQTPLHPPLDDVSSFLSAPVPSMSEPINQPKPSHRLAIALWPGFGMLAKDSSSVARSQRIALAAERAGFLLDAASTLNGIEAHSDIVEGDPLNTIFGNRSRAGILGSMSVWEVGNSYASVRIPRALQRTRLRRFAPASSVIIDSLTAGERIRSSVHNLRLAQEERHSDAAKYTRLR